MNKINIITIIGISLLASQTAMAQECGVAKTLEAVVTCVYPQVANLQILISACAYLGGIVLGIKGILKLKEYNDKKGQMSIGIPLVMIAAAGCLLALPSAVNYGMATLGIIDWKGNQAAAHGGGTFDYSQFKY